jgi:putative membrane protein
MDYTSLQYIVPSLVYSLVGVIVLVTSFVVIEKIAPENLWKEIVDKQNVALAILAGAFMLSLAIIISSAIHG